MAQVPQPKFSVGQRVFDADGRTGLVTEVFFLPERDTFRYLVDGIPDVLDEDELQDAPFTVSEPLTPREQLEVRLLVVLQANPGLDVRFWVGREIGVDADTLDEAPGQPGGGTLEDALAFWAAQGFFLPGEEPQPSPPVEEVVPPPVVEIPKGLELEAILEEVDRRIALAIGPVVENMITERQAIEARVLTRLAEWVELTNKRFALRESMVTDVLSRIESSLLALEQEAQEVAGTDLRGLFALLGGFVRDPLAWFLERAEDAIQEEILDGLTR